MTLGSTPAEAGCKWFKATHNGTDFFYSDGAAGTAEYKLNGYISQWKAAKGIRRAKVYRAKTKCGDWFIKYMLPHKHCIAKAKVCY
ncbi:MAG: hypothetical protein MPJ78_06135 [Hyphomicrobiaceae bacterium]|nr:hypothetical protein [Hyphomicrobiaceae bacterium]